MMHQISPEEQLLRAIFGEPPIVANCEDVDDDDIYSYECKDLDNYDKRKRRAAKLKRGQ